MKKTLNRNFPVGIASVLPWLWEEQAPHHLTFRFDPKGRIASLFCMPPYTTGVLQLKMLSPGFVDTEATSSAAVDSDFSWMVILQLKFTSTKMGTA